MIAVKSIKTLQLFRFTLSLLCFSIFTTVGIAQEIEKDIFNDLKYETRFREFTASFTKDIFDDYTYKDNRGNEVVYKKEYMKWQWGNRYNDFNIKSEFFRTLISKYYNVKGYKATIARDFFDKQTTIEENKNLETDTNLEIDTRNNTLDIPGVTETISKDAFGQWKFDSNSNSALLKKVNGLGQWNYEDSKNTNITLVPDTWRALKRRFGSEKAVFRFLIRTFLIY